MKNSSATSDQSSDLSIKTIIGFTVATALFPLITTAEVLCLFLIELSDFVSQLAKTSLYKQQLTRAYESYAATELSLVKL